jgi:hypothetical protein
MMASSSHSLSESVLGDIARRLTYSDLVAMLDSGFVAQAIVDNGLLAAWWLEDNTDAEPSVIAAIMRGSPPLLSVKNLKEDADHHPYIGRNPALAAARFFDLPWTTTPSQQTRPKRWPPVPVSNKRFVEATVSRGRADVLRAIVKRVDQRRYINKDDIDALFGVLHGSLRLACEKEAGEPPVIEMIQFVNSNLKRPLGRLIFFTHVLCHNLAVLCTRQDLERLL